VHIQLRFQTPAQISHATKVTVSNLQLDREDPNSSNVVLFLNYHYPSLLEYEYCGFARTSDRGGQFSKMK